MYLISGCVWVNFMSKCTEKGSSTWTGDMGFAGLFTASFPDPGASDRDLLRPEVLRIDAEVDGSWSTSTCLSWNRAHRCRFSAQFWFHGKDSSRFSAEFFVLRKKSLSTDCWWNFAGKGIKMILVPCPITRIYYQRPINKTQHFVPQNNQKILNRLNIFEMATKYTKFCNS
jgi:hypothetical protein